LFISFLSISQAEKSDGWDTDPFTLVIDKDTGRLIGRGSSDDKGPVLGWVNVLDAHKSLGIEIPVNLRFCFEGMEESGSEGLDDLIKSEVEKGAEGWFQGVDCVCIVRCLASSVSPASD
jgi:Cys-Gly metallodipeptidase DUG1